MESMFNMMADKLFFLIMLLTIEGQGQRQGIASY